jgi:4-amino-4-deoxy-L-arabinose transferase-like glycosyltransferase
LRHLHSHRFAVVTDPPREAPTLSAEPASRISDETAARHRPSVDGWLLGALGVTLLALGLRLTGISFGLPDHFHWDEPTVMNRVIRMGGGDLNPHFFYYPSLLMYVLLVAQGALYAVGHVLHWYPSADSFAVSYLTDSSASYLVGRALVASLGAGTVLLAFVVGRRFFSAPAALIGAALLAVSPVHIGSSHFITNDVPMAFFAVLAYVFLWDVYRRGAGRDYVAAGVVTGLGVATKYLPVVLLVSLLLAHAFRLRNQHGTWRAAGRDLGWPVVAAAAAFAAFAVASPYVLLDWRSALHDYAVQGSLSNAAGCSDCGLNFGPYLTQTLGWSIGWAAYLLALVGLASIGWLRGERRLRAILFASFPIMLFLMVGSERQPWPRWLVPIAPFACLAAGAILWAAFQRLALVLRRRPTTGGARRAAWLVPAVTAATVLVAAQPAVASSRFDASLLRADPRTQAVAWFEATVPSGTAVAVQPLLGREFFTAQLHTDAQLRDLESWLPARKAYLREAVGQAYARRPVYREPAFSYSFDTLQSEGVRYVVLSSAHYHQVAPASEDRLYAALASRGWLRARFRPSMNLPDADEYPVSAPTITVYELPRPGGVPWPPVAKSPA